MLFQQPQQLGARGAGKGVVEMGLKTACYTHLPVFGVNYIEFQNAAFDWSSPVP